MKKFVFCCLFLLALLAQSVNFSFAAEDSCPQSGKDKIQTKNLVCDYHANRILKSELPLKNGKKQGLVKEYYESGKLKSEVIYKDDKREGLSKFYHENGKLYLKLKYINDSLVRGMCYHIDGTKKDLTNDELDDLEKDTPDKLDDLGKDTPDELEDLENDKPFDCKKGNYDLMLLGH